MALADRPSNRGFSPLSRKSTRLFLASFFAITIVLAYFAAKAILHDAENPELQQRVEAFRERKTRNSLFAPADSTSAPVQAGADTTDTP
ncbi:MAG: hypothetical protein R2834_07640 [Rhodothermales bacterium]